MNRLEERYRRVLRLLPAYYREAWEEDMVATFLAGAQPWASSATEDPEATEATEAAEAAEFADDYGRPDLSEVASVVALAVRLRLGGAGAPPRSLAWGDALRRVALAGLLVHAVTALTGLGILAVHTAQFPALYAPDRVGLAWALGDLLWVAAFVTLVLGRWHVARVLAVLALMLSALALGIETVAQGGPYMAAQFFGLLAEVLPVVALAAFHRHADPVRPRPWLTALVVGTVLVSAMALTGRLPWYQVLVDWPGMICVAVFATSLAYLLAPRLGWKQRTASWSIALALLALTALGLRGATLVDYLRFTADSQPLQALVLTCAVQGAAVLAVTVPLVVLAHRALRGLPSSTEPAVE